MENSLILNRDFSLPADGFYQIAPLGEFANAVAGVMQVIDRAACDAMAARFAQEAAVANPVHQQLRSFENVGSFAGAHLHETDVCQRFQRLAERGAADAQRGAELGFGWQFVSREPPALGYLRGQLAGDLLTQCDSGNGLEFWN